MQIIPQTCPMPEIDWKKIRENYPEIHRGLYFNTAFIGLVAQSQQGIIQEAMLKMTQNFSALRADLLEEMSIIREEIAASVCCPSDFLALIPNLSEGIYSVAQMLRPLQKVMLYKGDYPALNLPFQKLGYDIIWLEQEEDLSPENIEQSLLKSNTKILALSWVQFKTGYRIDLERIAQICKSLGILLVLDATQGWCVFQTDLEKNDHIIFVASAYKWATAGLGMGILAMSPKWLEQYPPPLISTSQISTYDYFDDLGLIPLSMRVFELGHPHLLGILMLRHGIQNIREMGIQNIQDRVLSLSRHLSESLENQGFTLLSSHSDAHRSSIVVIPFEQGLSDYLQANSVELTGRGAGIRLSVHFYNDFEDIDRLIEIIQAYKSNKK